VKKIVLPGTDLEISNMCFGPSTFGALIDERSSFEMMDFYVENGGNIIDTAHCYCDWLNVGLASSEKFLSRWMDARGTRGKVYIATKAGHFKFDAPSVPRVTAEEVKIDILESLDNLKVDRLDFLWLHRDNTNLPVGEIIEFMNDYKNQGLIKWFGGSNWSATRLEEARIYAEKHGLENFAGVQNHWNAAHLGGPLVDETCVFAGEEDLAFYKKNNFPLFAYCSQANGFFSKLDALGPDSLGENIKAMHLNKINISRLEKMKVLAKKYDSEINSIVLAYLTSQDFPCIPIFNCRNFDQLKSVISGSDLQLSTNDMLSLV